MAGCWLRLIRQVVEQQESLRIRFCSGLDERVRYSQFAQLLGPENQSRFGAAVVRIEHPQINQSRTWFPIRRPIRVVDGHHGVAHGFAPELWVKTETVEVELWKRICYWKAAEVVPVVSGCELKGIVG